MNEEHRENRDIREKILYTFNEIFDLQIKEIENFGIEKCEKVKEVVSEEQIDSYFKELA
ncbi:hypothetical protein [Anaerosporobacter sp.]|uniref:hypothetical protein n=1 Tax=Anaerosporobacter sp. TaxID=1872529 RepID=UPI00286F4E8F|nr:hypothetical protein [Anaerosporobacter sp.]